MPLQLLRVHHFVRPFIPKMPMMLMFLRFFGLFLRLPFLIIFDGFQNIELLDRDPFDLLDSQPFAEGNDSSADGDQAAQSDPDTGTPGGPIEPVPMPHPDAEQDLKDRVPQV